MKSQGNTVIVDKDTFERALQGLSEDAQNELRRRRQQIGDKPITMDTVNIWIDGERRPPHGICSRW